MAKAQKNFVFALFFATFVLVSLFLYSNLDAGTKSGDAMQRSVQFSNLQKQVEAMSDDLEKNKQEMEKIQKELQDQEVEDKKNQIEKENEVYDVKAEAEAAMIKNVDQLEGDADHKAVQEEKGGESAVEVEEKHVGAEPVHGNKAQVVQDFLRKKTTLSSANVDTCLLRNNYSHAQTDVQMLDVYDVLKFDNPDGGVWKQGWEVKYDSAKVSAEPQLEVIVIPHSHCDPGWIKTFEEYFRDQTSNILSGMAKHLGEKPDMRFIYAEMSFFEMWWKSVDEATREKVKGYLKSGQFEIVTGGWVMTDEANAHYYSIVTELMEGHEWIRNHIGADFRPRSHWSIDPFGLSPVLPQLLSAANITNAALQRVHYSVKKHLAKNKQLEFMWRQLWGSHGESDVRTHVFPFYSYDVPHTCGPEPRVCCQFDFRRLPGGGHTCPWNVPPQKISKGNLAERAFMLYDQYRKKSQLYKTNVLLIPLGDDFRYDTEFEWEEQYGNYKQLFEYMNENKEWNVKARFGTLSDYFDSLGKEMQKDDSELPVLTGDFFTYADRDDHYWSGYFTSRPFYKQMDRVLQHHLRSAEIAHSLSAMNGNPNDEIFAELVSARRALSLFQHHDGVTGTAKDAVVIDYGEKMLSALRSCEKVLSASLRSLLSQPSGDLLLSEIREKHDMLPEDRVYSVGQSIVVFNPLSKPRSEPMCIIVSSPNAQLKAETNDKISQQIGPVIKLTDGALQVVDKQYELCFSLNIGPFAVTTLELVEQSNDVASRTTVQGKNLKSAGNFETSPLSQTISLKTDQLTAVFDSASGYLKSVTPSAGESVDVNLNFVHYGARGHKKFGNGGGDDLSGAYLFLPDAVAKEVDGSEKNDILVVEGPLVKRVYVAGPEELKIMQKYTLMKGQYSVDIETEVDIRQKLNYELAMRLSSSVKSGDDLYTDLNGLQMIRRRRMLDKLPLQAHFYPMPGSAYIEDSNTRLSLLGAQALGVASLSEGQLEVMLDRRLNQDDGRGLFQGVLDNKRTLSRFRVLVEPFSGPAPDGKEARIGFLTPVAHTESMELHYPAVKMQSKVALPLRTVAGLKQSLPCDVHVVTLRTLAGKTDYDSSNIAKPLKEAALITHRVLPDCRSKLKNKCSAESNTLELKSLLPQISGAQSASLTLLYGGSSTDRLELKPQQMKAVKLLW